MLPATAGVARATAALVSLATTMSRTPSLASLLLLAQACATTTEEFRVTDPAAIAEARAADQAADPATQAAPRSSSLRLKVDANGGVRDAQVVESAGAKADQAALQAVYRLHFNPAHKDGQPVESTIRFAFTYAPER